MAMLAEPRRKQKVINLRAKNNAWSNDTNKFGQRMLEKMGWSSGKGLGANENGIVEHVVARYKNDDRGLGFEDKNDQWTKHEEDFNALLSNLSNGDSKDEKLHSGVSLEDKSKKSRARVHYHKFTRGKDLTRYSEKDLANIFGKKTFNNEKPEEILKEDIKTTEQVFTEKGSMIDYFKNKLASLKSNNKMDIPDSYTKSDYEADYSFKGFAGAASGDSEEAEPNVAFQGFSLYNPVTINEDKLDYDTVEQKIIKKKKKSKKNKQDQDLSDTVQIETEHKDNLDNENEPVKKTKPKKSKLDPESDENTLNNEVFDKKSKNKKHKLEIVANQKNEEIVEQEHHVPKKKKKRKNKDLDN